MGDDSVDEILDAMKTQAFQADPYPYYQRLRERAPVARAIYFWFFTRHRDCRALLQDDRWDRREEPMCLQRFPDELAGARGPQLSAEEAVPAAEPSVLELTAALSRPRLRELFAGSFRPSHAHALREPMRRIAGELASAAVEKGDVDLLREFIWPYTALVMCELLGVPDSDRELFTRWSHAWHSSDPTATGAEAAAERDREIHGYLREFVAERRRRPGHDVFSRLAAVEDGGRPLDERELVGAFLLVFLANEATINVLANGTLALIRHPDQLRRFRQEPGLAPAAVEELMRYDTPAQVLFREAREDIVVEGQRIEKGEVAFVFVGAANRDPEVFDRPDQVDLARRDNRHLAFGHGHVYCPGAPLARPELQLGFESLLGRARVLELRAEPTYQPTLVARAVTALPVSLR